MIARRIDKCQVITEMRPDPLSGIEFGCGVLGLKAKERDGHHVDECPLRIVECPNRCYRIVREADEV